MQTIEKKKIEKIDFNVDIAQSFGVYKNNKEYSLIDYASSVNISCGFHAGDPMAIKEALLTAKNKNVVVGAHIGFHDIQGFGYRPMELSEDEIEALVVYQVGALMSFAKTYKLEIEHVRPHGAMYQQAAEDYNFACAIAKAVKKCSQWLVYYGAAGDVIRKVEESINIPIAQEVHLEKIYNTDGTIDFSRNDIENIFASMNRFKNLLATSQIDNVAGGQTFVYADTVHFTNKIANAEALIRQASELMTPVPVNYKNARKSGWVD